MSIFPDAEEPPRPAARPVAELERIGGRLALDFTNTVGDSRAHPKEYLTTYAAWLEWSEAAGAIGPDVAARLRERSAGDPAGAAEALEAARLVREALYRIFEAVAGDEDPDPADLAVLNARVGPAMAGLRVEAGEDGFAWRAEPPEAELDAPLGPVVRDAADLLVSGDLARVKRCGGVDCDWLFVDESRNRSRRWCDMADCGNRAKQRRHYRRTRSG